MNEEHVNLPQYIFYKQAADILGMRVRKIITLVSQAKLIEGPKMNDLSARTLLARKRKLKTVTAASVVAYLKNKE